MRATRIFLVLGFLLSCLEIFTSRALAEEAKPCRDTTLVFPPAVDDAALAIWLSREATKALRESQVLKCLRTLESDKARDTLSFIGYSAYRKITLNDLKSKQLKILKDDLGVNQIMLMEFGKGKSPAVTARVFRLQALKSGDFSAKLIHKFRITLDPAQVAENRSPFLKRYIPFFAPNSVSLGTTYSEITMNPSVEYEVESTRIKSTLPAVLTSFSLTHMAHPDSYGMFDTSLVFSPRLLFFSLDQYTTLKRRPDYATYDIPETKEIHLSVIGSCGTIDATGSVYWPLGTSYLALGVGPCLYGAKPEQEKVSVLPDFGMRFTFGHSFFITRRTFFYLEFGGFSFGKVLYHNEFAQSSNLSRSSVGIGYYFTDVENKLTPLVGLD